MKNGRAAPPLVSNVFHLAQRCYGALPRALSPSGRALPAWHYVFEVTRRCNLRCSMCRFSSFLNQVPPDRQAEGELGTDAWLDVVRQTGPLTLVTFTGGEPFVREDFLELLAAASRKSRTHVLSNLTLLDGDRTAQLSALAPKRLGGAGCNVIGTSLEGPRETHDLIRGKLGAFDRTVAVLRELRERRDLSRRSCPTLWATAVIQSANVDCLHELPGIVAAAGADTLNLVMETRINDDQELAEAGLRARSAGDFSWPRIESGRLAAALDRTEAAAREAGIEFRTPPMPREELLRYYAEDIDLRRYICRSAWSSLLVGHEGAAYACWMKKVGDARKTPLREIWNGEEMRSFRRECRSALFAACPGCSCLEHR